MPLSLTFRFVDDTLNRRLIGLLKKSHVEHSIDDTGVIHYSPDDEELIGNDLISSIRDQVFPSWQVLSCPSDWVGRYKQYMDRHSIPFQEELTSDGVEFLLPRKYRPHAWKLEEAELAKSGQA